MAKDHPGSQTQRPYKPAGPTAAEQSARKQTAEDTLALFGRNLAAVREHYRAQPSSGHELGHNAITELVVATVSSALECAVSGEVWKAPGV